MFIRIITTFLLFFSISTSVFAIHGFTKEGGGYGVKPIRELIKESEEGLHSSMNLNDWIAQRGRTPEIGVILSRYKKALQIRKQIQTMYNMISDIEYKTFKRKILFIQGLLIIKLDNVETVELTNGVIKHAEDLIIMQEITLDIMGIQIDDGYMVIDLLKSHTIRNINTNLLGGVSFELTSLIDNSQLHSITDNNGTN